MGSVAEKDFNLLLVDDERAVLSSLQRIFRTEPVNTLTAEDGREALTIAELTRIDAAIIDLKMPGMDGLELLRLIKAASPLTKVLILTGQGRIRDAVTAVSLGAVDFLEKPVDPDALRQRILEICASWKENHLSGLSENVNCPPFDFPELIGESPAMMEVKKMISRVGNTNASVLIQGESGTGKELVASAIHHHSTRRTNPFVPVDCASLGDSLMQSELFGHEKGAFTGAQNSTSGLIRAAHEGTLFLDEIGEMDMPLQARILRTLQEKSVRPVGGHQVHDVDIRVISATNRQLAIEVAEQRFREDLFYRLNTVTIELPPLRERREDIPSLAERFVEKYNSVNSRVRRLSEETGQCLLNYSWPGNVRQLANVIFRAIILCNAPEITPDSLPKEICGHACSTNRDSETTLQGWKLEDYERLAIVNALAKAGNNRRQAAQILDIGEATLYRKLKKYNLD